MLFLTLFSAQWQTAPSAAWLWLSFLCLSTALRGIAAKTAADYYVSSMPGQPAGPLLTMHAG